MREFYQDRRGKWRFRVKGKNGEKLLTSEQYASRGNAVRGYQDLKKVMDEDCQEDTVQV